MRSIITSFSILFILTLALQSKALQCLNLFPKVSFHELYDSPAPVIRSAILKKQLERIKTTDERFQEAETLFIAAYDRGQIGYVQSIEVMLTELVNLYADRSVYLSHNDHKKLTVDQFIESTFSLVATDFNFPEMDRSKSPLRKSIYRDLRTLQDIALDIF